MNWRLYHESPVGDDRAEEDRVPPLVAPKRSEGGESGVAASGLVSESNSAERRRRIPWEGVRSDIVLVYCVKQFRLYKASLKRLFLWIDTSEGHTRKIFE